MKTNLMSTPVLGLVSDAVRERFPAPIAATQATAVPCAGRPAAAATAPVAVLGGHLFDLPGLPLRAAPV